MCSVVVTLKPLSSYYRLALIPTRNAMNVFMKIAGPAMNLECYSIIDSVIGGLLQSAAEPLISWAKFSYLMVLSTSRRLNRC